MEPDNPQKPDWEHAHWYVKEPDPDEDKPANPLIRWSIIVVLTLLAAAGFGLAAAFAPYFTSSHDRSAQHDMWQFAQSDTMGYFKLRFILGAIGGAVTSFIWLYRLTRDD